MPIIYDVPGTYHFTGAVAYDRLGSSWRTAAGLRSVSVIDGVTGLLPTNLVQDGVAVTWLTADEHSRYSFTCDVPGVVVDFGAGAEAIYAAEVPLLATTEATTVQAIADAAAASAAAAAASAALVGAPASAAIDAHLGGDATNLVPAVAGKVAKGDIVYRVADYATPQDCLDAAPVGALVLFPPGNITVTVALSVAKAVTILGGGMRNSSVTANGCDAFVGVNGVGDVSISNLAIKATTRYTTTPNTFVGIKILGDSTHKPSVHRYRDIYIDGFETGIQANYLWTSVFDNVQTAFGLIGIDGYGLSENNMVGRCNLVVGDGTQTRVNGSASIRLNGQVSRTDTTSVVSEGWIISNNLMYGGDYGVLAQGFANYQVANCILDAIQICGVRVAIDGTSYGGNCLIQGNYIAMATNSVSSTGAITVANTVAAIRGVKIRGNDIFVYTGGSVTYGVYVIADASSTALVEGNTIQGFTTNDIKFSSSNNIAIGNRCLSPGVTPNFNIYSDSGQINLISDNIGTVFVSAATFPNNYAVSGGFMVCRAPTAPTAFAWSQGDRVVNSAPAVGSPKGWVCTVDGTPGTWVSEGNL